jgi:hypothetical protein
VSFKRELITMLSMIIRPLGLALLTIRDDRYNDLRGTYVVVGLNPFKPSPSRMELFYDYRAFKVSSKVV